MQSEDARFIKKRFRAGAIDVHPTEKALIVNYELEAFILGEHGDPILGESKKCQKLIRLRSLHANTNCRALANEVVDKCALIHKSKLNEVEHLIYYLKNRKQNAFTDSNTATYSEGNMSINSQLGPGDKPSFNNMEDYLELLYEDLQEKVRGSALILELAKEPNNLEELSNRDSVLSALSRVLREDWRKSIELSTNIVYIFFCFSTYSIFHPIIMQFKVGSLCIEIIDYELKRYDEWKSSLENQEKKDEPKPSRLPVRMTKSAIDTKRPKSSGIPIMKTDPRRHSLHVDDKSRSNSPVSVGERRQSEGLKLSTSVTEIAGDKNERSAQKFEALARKQDQLLRISFYMLLNISENTKVEDKMRKKNIVGLLIRTLDRNTVELLVLVVMFLMKLSVYRENKDKMAELNIIDKLPRLFMIGDKNLESATIKLVYNLSFDSFLREKMIRDGFLQKLVTLLNDSQHAMFVMGTMYHLSLDDRVKAMFAYTNCVPLIIDMLINAKPDEPPDTLLIALCINLALNTRNAEIMIENGRLKKLMHQAFEYQNGLLMQLIRNISKHSTTKHNFIEYVGDLAKVLTSCSDELFMFSCCGILSNMIIPELDFDQLIKQYHLIPWIKKYLKSDNDDKILEIIVFIGTAAVDDSCAESLCRENILTLLIDILKAKQEDDEMVLQIIYVFYQMSRHPVTRDLLIKSTEAPAYLIDLMHDNNPNIRRVCDACLNFIKLYDKEWAEKIKIEKFTWHNSQWLEVVENKTLESSPSLMNDDSEIFPRYDLFQQSMLFNAGSHASIPGVTGDDIEILSNNPLSDEDSRPNSRYEASDFDEFDLELAQAQRPEMEKNLQFMRKKTPIMKSSLNGVEAVRYEIDETDEDDDEC
ncbi:unnamed protein product [Bemisia tabaci]|uniref:Kinesin-associated protein 3 n=1 Tax=Bemisia tabaci TaxID=7038 RepID=A0A9P0G5X5_BEMTA|nr:unnamed protein product [Bemisia tabaci]